MENSQRELSKPIFKGNIEKIVIETSDCSYMMPKQGQEIKQRLTINFNGNVSFTRYYAGDYSQDPPIEGTKETKRYKRKTTEKMMEYIARYFREPYEDLDVLDCAIWKIVLTNTEGMNWHYSGAAIEDLIVGGYGLSAVTRNSFEMPELWVFDMCVGDMVMAKPMDNCT